MGNTESKVPTETTTLEEVAKHKHKTDCWVAIHGMVYNVTEFMEDHPGGSTILLDVGGACVCVLPCACVCCRACVCCSACAAVRAVGVLAPCVGASILPCCVAVLLCGCAAVPLCVLRALRAAVRVRGATVCHRVLPYVRALVPPYRRAALPLCRVACVACCTMCSMPAARCALPSSALCHALRWRAL